MYQQIQPRSDRRRGQGGWMCVDIFLASFLVLWQSALLKRLGAAGWRRVEVGEIEQPSEVGFEMFERLGIQAVVHPAGVSLFSALKQETCSTQDAKVMAGHALGDAEQVFQVADTQLALD